MAGGSRCRWLLAVAGVVLAWAVVVCVALVTAHGEMRQGLEGVDTARKDANAASVAEGRLIPQVRTARSHFAAAHGRVSGALLAPARVLPFVGRQLRSVSALSGAATTLADVAIAGMNDAQPILAEPGGSNAARAASARRLGQLAGRADTQLQDLGLGPRVGLLDTLASARNRLATRVAELRGALGKAATGGNAVADLLEGPRRYLVFAANNAEMRAGSGMFLSAGELQTGPEGLRLGSMRSVTEIPIPTEAVPLPPELADRWGWLEPNADWRNLMTSPRFDLAAPLAAQMWVAAGNAPVDGVMVIDPVALAGLLRGTGPVEAGGRRYTEENVVEELLHAQYLRFPRNEDRPERREGLGTIAAAIFTALDRGNWSLANLASGLADASAGRHLLMWTGDRSQQSGWEALGVDGALHPDSLMLSVLNRGGNKLDPFLRINSELSFATADNQTEVTLTIRLENRVPPGEPPYIAGPHPRSGVGEGVYLGILTLNIPEAGLDAGFQGVEQLAVHGADGPSRVLGFQFDLPRGAERTVVARFRLPERAGAVRVEPSARVPLVTWTSGSRTWRDTAARVVTWGA